MAPRKATNGVSKTTATTKKADVPAKVSRARRVAPPPTSEDPESEHAQDSEVEPVPAKKTAAPKRTATKKAAPVKAAPVKEHVQSKQPAKVPKTNGIVNGNKKRKTTDDEDEVATAPAPPALNRPVKKARTRGPPPEAAETRLTAGPPIIELPSKKRLDVYVFGEGSSGELGLGSKKYNGKKPIDVKRPRINHNLDAAKVGVVQIACGGMHAVVLTHDNKILTWGVNDDGALGRDTHWEGRVRDVDDESSDDDEDDDTGINPLESTPTEVDMSAALEGSVFVQVIATDSASFVRSADGRVYGWGTFRGSDGIIGFAEGIRVQRTPILVDHLSDITKLASGANHILALDRWGKVLTWGSGGQYQLGRKAVTRRGGLQSALKPEPCGRFTKKHFAVDIAAGSYHSFYKSNHKEIYSWGLNNFSQTGHIDDTGKDDAQVLIPKVVDTLSSKNVDVIDGGMHHSLACTEDGELLTWGRVDGYQTGHSMSLFTADNAIFDDNQKPRILVEPTPIPGIKATFVAAGTDNSFAIDVKGRVHSWGFSANYQTGQGTFEDIAVPTEIDNSALRDRVVNWAGAGGQYSIVTTVADIPENAKNEPQAPNGAVEDQTKY